ncbi:MAG: hypothetical protein AAGE52_21250 [Myxococcota bacterium]
MGRDVVGIGFIAALLCIAGCASREDVSATSSSLNPDRELVRSALWTLAAGSDQEPAYLLAWEAADGTRTASGLGPVLHGVRWRDQIAYVDRAHTLRLSEESQPLATDVVGAPVVSEDVLGFVRIDETARGTWFELHRVSDRHRVLARARGSLGDLRIAPGGQAIFGVGARNGGVAGLWVADAAGLRCLTNCNLRVGEPWGDAFVPPPSTDTLRFDGPEVLFDTPHGAMRRRWQP